MLLQQRTTMLGCKSRGFNGLQPQQHACLGCRGSKGRRLPTAVAAAAPHTPFSGKGWRARRVWRGAPAATRPGGDDGYAVQEQQPTQPQWEWGAGVRREGQRTFPPSSRTPAVLLRGDVLQGRYTIQDVLGSGSNATTYLASDPEGRQVAIKALSLSSLKDWKQLDLFQREAQILASLQHPAIPRYVDYFEQDSDTDKRFYIVQEVVQGKSLGQLISEGKRATDEEAIKIATQLLQVLEYLASLRPAVVHRDIKPENIIMEGGTWGGRAFLVDFGGVQGVVADNYSLGSTIIGTYGYMSPEQFRGTAQPASDLYGVGATLLFLLTGRPPFDFPQERMRIQWRDALPYLPPDSVWPQLLDGLLEPVAEDRLSAKQALALLRGEALVAPSSSGRAQPQRRDQGAAQQALTPPRNARDAWLRTQTARQGAVTTKPAGSRVNIERSGARLDVMIPPKGLSVDTGFTGAFAVAWNAFVAVWTVSALASGGILFALFSLPFWFAGVQIGKQAVVGALMRERFAVGPNKFRVGQELALFKDGKTDFSQSGKNEKVTEGSTAQLTGARIVTTMFVNDEPQTIIELVEGANKYRFGEGLELSEQQWVVYEINSHLESLQGRPVDYEAMPQPEVPKSYWNDQYGTRGDGSSPP